MVILLIFMNQNDKALNKITNEIIDIETDPTKGLSPKIWPYYFFSGTT